MKATTNIVVGYGVALIAQIIVFSAMGIPVLISQHIQIGLIFTVVSLVRSYVLRRIFNRIKR